MINQYSKTIWANNTAPARNATNLNNQESGIYSVTEETRRLAGLVDSDKVSIDYAPQSTPPSYKAGRTFYDSSLQQLSFFTDITDFYINSGGEVTIKVYNNTGSIISAGTPIYGSGGSTSGLPHVSPSIAINFTSSTCDAVAAHDIAIDSYGYVKNIGYIDGVDTSTFAPGDRLYVSDISLGGLTNILPDIVSFVGVVTQVGISGSILVNPVSNIALPTLDAYMDTLDTPAVTVSTTATKFVNFTNADNVVIQYDKATGLFTAPKDGAYGLIASIAVSSVTSSIYARSIQIRARINESATGEKVFPIIIGRSGEEGAMTMHYRFNITAGDTISLWYNSSNIAESVNIDYISLEFKSINIR